MSESGRECSDEADIILYRAKNDLFLYFIKYSHTGKENKNSRS
jgi:hypothetical protein